jgi:DNA-binding NtrC family response regulator
MKRILVCWIGSTDLRAAKNGQEVGLGPIAQAVKTFEYDEVVLLNNYPEQEVAHFVPWLKKHTSAGIFVRQQALSSPTNFGEIYEAAVSVLEEITKKQPQGVEWTFHLSPGTPAMAAVWVILAKTRFPATLIESSREHGARVASVPFDISADFLPDLMRKPDKRLETLSDGRPPEAPEFEDITHRSAVMKRLVARARRVAPRSIPVLIEGESGTGKELLARAIHRTSPRTDKEFIAVNCGAIPVELVESELFGHEKGAFTGAESRKIGYFEAAQGGTVFLDEVGELPLRAQVKVLRTLQEGEVTRVGATRSIKVDFRVISATNRSLTEEIAKGTFRADLFYRLAVAVLQLPPIRQRPGDLSLLIDNLLEQVNQESMEEPGFVHKKLSATGRNLLLNHGWPGNVRELLNTLRRAAIWSEGPTITAEDVREAILPVQSGDDNQILNRPLGEGFDLPGLLAKVVRHYLAASLEQASGNKTQAATLLGLPSYQTLTNWLKKYGVTT